MIAEKPSWIRHEGLQIFSIDVQPGGLRVATGGGDHKVRVWNMQTLGKDFSNEESAQRLLATLLDHFGSVNCVRWAKHARSLASGSDDQVILIHEMKPGSGTTDFGSGEAPDVENWKVVITLRGHTADVVNLNWSPDDSMLASGSLDNTIHIWNMSNGICTAVLRGHSSLVKGVTWDPIGSFIASQSDDKTVIIWRTSDWSLIHKTDGHWTKSLGSTFFRRLGWSPCGHFITTTHGYQKPRHSAPVLERGEWSATFDFLGHSAPVIVVKFNHSMFKRNFSNAQEGKAAPVGWTNGTSKIGGKEKELQPYNVIAIGSQDRTITVWTTASPRPLFVAKHYFTQSVVDLSWSPDGYSLFACSLDGSVATFHFEVKELGHRLSDADLDELKRSHYGDVRGRQVNLAESPAQLMLEAASTKQAQKKKVARDGQQSQTVKPSADVGVTTKASECQVDDQKKSGGASADSLNKVQTPAQIYIPVNQREYRRPDGRKRIIPEAVGEPPLKRSGGASADSLNKVQTPAQISIPVKQREYRQPDGRKRIIPEAVGEPPLKRSGGASADSLNKVQTPAQISIPVKQREYRQPDGRKRIIPEAVGVPPLKENISVGAHSPALDFPLMPSDHRKDDSGLVAADRGIKETSVRETLLRGTDIKDGHGVTARAMITNNLVIEKVPTSTGGDERISIEQSGAVKASNSVCGSSAIRGASADSLNKVQTPAQISIPVKQREYRQPDGRKRIIPEAVGEPPLKRSGGASADSLNKVQTPAQISIPVKQREYRQPDGRKRIIPEAVGVPPLKENISVGAHSPALDFPLMPSDHRKDDGGLVAADRGIKETSVRETLLRGTDIKDGHGVTARAMITNNLVIEKVPTSTGGDERISIEQSGAVKASNSVCGSSAILSIRVFNKKDAEDAVTYCLEARPKEHAANDIIHMENALIMKETEITCTRGVQTLWSDRISGKVTVLAGNANFWAVGCEDGCIQVYTNCGRRAMPTMMVGSAAVFIDCDECWKLFLVTRKGSLYLWDLLKRNCLLHESLSSLIALNPDHFANDAGMIKVISAKLSRSGSPLVVLATRHAFLFDMGLMCWLRVADDCFSGSNFASSWHLGLTQSGELASLQVDVKKYLARKPGWSRVTDDGVQTRAHLEAQLASLLALNSPNEYRQCLLSYIRFLAREADESRLREVCESFLGPPTGMVETTSLDSKNLAWDPFVLGMGKHKLLREDILPAMASNRKVQRLLNEFMDLISEYGSADMNVETKTQTSSTALLSAPEPMQSAPSSQNKMDSVSLATNQAKPVPDPSE